jgi:hypothetical protein
MTRRRGSGGIAGLQQVSLELGRPLSGMKPPPKRTFESITEAVKKWYTAFTCFTKLQRKPFINT